MGVAQPEQDPAVKIVHYSLVVPIPGSSSSPSRLVPKFLAQIPHETKRKPNYLPDLSTLPQASAGQWKP